MYTIHEDQVEFKKLPGRDHKMIIGPQNFGGAKNMCFGVAVFPPVSHAPAHVHPKEEEILYVLSGHGEVYFDGKPETVKPGTCIYVPPGVEHSIRNLSKGPLKVSYVFSPPTVQGSYDRKQ
jgi:mannose-6-phosphate isomerase-like protein (cupin superfamily)